MRKYIEVNIEQEKPKSDVVLTPSGMWLYINGKFRCMHSGVEQEEIKTLLKIVD